MQISELDELIAKLDEKYSKWELYRAYDNTWRFTDKVQTMIEGTMSECLESALTHVVLPIVPRYPQAVELEEFTVTGKAGRWAISHKGYCIQSCIKTKAKATESITAMCARNAERRRVWDRDYGWTRHKQEGVDFKYEK